MAMCQRLGFDRRVLIEIRAKIFYRSHIYVVLVYPLCSLLDNSNITLVFYVLIFRRSASMRLLLHELLLVPFLIVLGICDRE